MKKQMLMIILIVGICGSFLLASNKSEYRLSDILTPFFEEVHVVQWVVFNSNNKEVYVGFKANYNPSRPGPLKMIMGSAAMLAYEAGCVKRGKVELWSVDATRTNRNWVPNTGIEAWMLTVVHPSGRINHIQ